MGGGSPSGRPADLGTRFLARLIDSVLIGIVTTVVVFTIFFGAILGTSVRGGIFQTTFSVTSWISTLIVVALTIGYYAVLESSNGQTPGKMIMSIEVRAPGGGHPSLEMAIKRNAWIALQIVPVIGLLVQLGVAIYIAVTINSGNGSGWHDEFAGGTVVVQK